MPDVDTPVESSPTETRSAGESLYRDMPSEESAPSESEALPSEEVARTEPESDPGDNGKAAEPIKAANDDKGSDEDLSEPQKIPYRRFKQVVARTHELEVQLAEARGQLKNQPRQQNEVSINREPVAERKRPLLEDHTTWDEWKAADDKWVAEETDARIKQAIEADRAAQESKRHAAEAEKARVEGAKVWVSREKDTEKRDPEYRDVVYNEKGQLRPDLPMNDIISSFVAGSKIGPDLLLHIARNPEAGKAIMSTRDPLDQVRALVNLENSIHAKLKPSPSTIRAPRPPATVNEPAPRTQERSIGERLYK